jgi:hypothetical protein
MDRAHGASAPGSCAPTAARTSVMSFPMADGHRSAVLHELSVARFRAAIIRTYETTVDFLPILLFFCV